MTGAEARAVRKALKLTEIELGHWLMLKSANAHNTVRAWEKGKREVSGPVTVALAAFAAGFVPGHVGNEENHGRE